MANRSSTSDRTTVSMRLGVCAAALGGTAATSSDASAQIVTFNTPIVVPQTFAGVYINLLTGATGTSSALPGWDFNPYASGTTIRFFWNSTPTATSGGVAGTSTGPYLNLAPGTVVGPASTFSQTIAGTTGSDYLTTGTRTLGFRFQNEDTSTVNYGYLTMTTTGTGGFPATITEWSFESSGGPITVVPEPATIGLSFAAMAMGAVGVRRWRREKATPLAA